MLPFTQWVLLYLNALLVWGEKSKYFVGTQYVPGVPDPGRKDSTCAHLIFTLRFIHINESMYSLMYFYFWLVVPFMISEQRGNAEDMTFLTTLSSVHPNISPQADIRAVYFVDMCLGRKWHSVVFISSISGIHNGGFCPLVHYYQDWTWNSQGLSISD